MKDPRAIAITEKLANRHRLKKGDPLPLIFGSKRVTLTITHLLKMEGPAKSLEGNFGLMDIAAAQEALEKVGLIDRIDLIVDPSIPFEALEKELKKVIPQGTEIRRTETRSGQIEKMVSAFHLNLTALEPHLLNRGDVSDLQCHFHLGHPEEKRDRNSPGPWGDAASGPQPLHR